MPNKNVYLDYAAATPLSAKVLGAMRPYFFTKFYNPSANYSLATDVRNDINKARSDIAKVLSVKANEIYFVSGGTEANNLAIKGVMDSFKNKNLVISAIEHESIIGPAKEYNCKVVPVDSSGIVDLAKLSKLIDKNTVLVSIMYANNEIGTIEPLIKIKNLLNTIRQDRLKDNNKTPLYFHTDACQAANYLSLNAAGLGVDLTTINGGKIYGPKQSAILYVNRNVRLKPQIVGGGQESGYRSGTENVANIIGFCSALLDVTKIKDQESKRLTDLRDYFISQLKLYFKNVKINGSMKHRLPNNINVSFIGEDSETLLFKLDEYNIMCSTGSACSAQKDNLSSTLLAIGLNETEILSSLRFSLGQETSKIDIDKTIKILQKILP